MIIRKNLNKSGSFSKPESWSDIYNNLLKAGEVRDLDPKELERLGLAAYLTGRDGESFRFLEEAHMGYLSRRDEEKAVQCAFWLGLMLMNAGETARSSGWISRGERILRDANNQDCAEKGLLLIPRALGALSMGEAGKALEVFEQVTAIGEQFQNADLIALGRLGIGQAMIRLGEVAGGIKILDETMITIETEEVFPLVSGIVFCAGIESCRKVWDLGRAREWTTALTRWCEAQPEMVPFRGECMVRRAEIFQFHGEWPKALEESVEACDLLTRYAGGSAIGEAYYRQAELHRMLGKYDMAEENYTEAARRGRKPQPGLSLMRLEQGNGKAAETSLRNTLRETRNMQERAELLPAAVRIMLAMGHSGEALDAAEEMHRIAGVLDAPYLYAMSSHCRGAVSHAQGAFQPALEQLQDAMRSWSRMNLPYESACTRELKGIVYRDLKDRDNSEAELAAAKWIFEQLGAVKDLERVNRLAGKARDQKTHGLTLRELQVLQLVASGKTNRSVADELFISERTVDRHVSNIFNKLGVSSRVEATAFALKNDMLKEGI